MRFQELANQKAHDSRSLAFVVQTSPPSLNNFRSKSNRHELEGVSVDSTHPNWQPLVVPMRCHSWTKDILRHERCKSFNLFSQTLTLQLTCNIHRSRHACFEECRGETHSSRRVRTAVQIPFQIVCTILGDLCGRTRDRKKRRKTAKSSDGHTNGVHGVHRSTVASRNIIQEYSLYKAFERNMQFEQCGDQDRSTSTCVEDHGAGTTQNACWIVYQRS